MPMNKKNLDFLKYVCWVAKSSEAAPAATQKVIAAFNHSSNTNFITGLGMCEVCSEAVHFQHERYHRFGHV